jgi:putative endonuclease
MSYTVYILECQNSSYYVGITTDLLRRYLEHVQGINCRYTRAFPPKHVAAAWFLENGGKSTALKLEYFIKKQNKKTKAEFIKNPEKLIDSLDPCWIADEDLVIQVVTSSNYQ